MRYINLLVTYFIYLFTLHIQYERKILLKYEIRFESRKRAKIRLRPLQ